MQRFAALGFPTLDDEEWRFTPLAPLTQTEFSLGGIAGADVATIQRLTFAPDGSHRLVFVNGRFAPALSSVQKLPQGTMVVSLADALKHNSDRIERHLAQHADYEDHAFTALNTAFIQDGAFVFLPKNAVVEQPIYPVFVSTAGREATVSHPRTLVV